MQRDGCSRRATLRRLAAGVAGIGLSGTAVGTGSTATTARYTETTGAGDEDYTSDALDFTDRRQVETYGDFRGYPGSTPSEYERRAFSNVVAHTGPDPIAGVEDEVQYTFVVNTSAATMWVDEDGDYVATADSTATNSWSFVRSSMRPSRRTTGYV